MESVTALRHFLYKQFNLDCRTDDLPSNISRKKISDLKKHFKEVKESYALSTSLNLEASASDLNYMEEILELVG